MAIMYSTAALIWSSLSLSLPPRGGIFVPFGPVIPPKAHFYIASFTFERRGAHAALLPTSGAPAI
jgi:hypothetical protein